MQILKINKHNIHAHVIIKMICLTMITTGA